MYKKITHFLIVVFIVSIHLFFYQTVKAQQNNTSERITFYFSHITINDDGSLLVSEEIDVQTNNETIKHGIYRDYPLSYRKYIFFIQKVHFEILDIKKDNKAEPYHTEKVSNGIRIYIGDENKLLAPGNYTYTITYKVDRMLGYFNDYDELYYNVTGNGWEFPIDEVFTTVRLPKQVTPDEINIKGYTGKSGSKAQNVQIEKNKTDGYTYAYISTISPLKKYEGLTIAVNWPKNIVPAPTQQTVLKNFLFDNYMLFFAFFAAVVIFSYYFVVWYIKGRDPEKGVIYPQFEPPKDLAPAIVRYINRMRFDNKHAVCALIDSAVKGYITINKKNSKYTIQKTNRSDIDISQDEKMLLDCLFTSTEIPKVNLQLFGKPILTTSYTTKEKNLLTFSKSNHVVISHALNSFKKIVCHTISNKYIATHTNFLIPGICMHIFFFLIFGGLLFIEGNTAAISLLVFAFFWNGVLSIFIFGIIIPAWIDIIHNQNRKNLLSVTLFTCFIFPFVFVGLLTLLSSGATLPILVPVFMILPLILHPLFAFWIKARTVEGRAIQDAIEGFKMFLGTTEREKIKILYPAIPHTFEIFEKYLPYAIALDVEKNWSEQFSDVLTDSEQIDNAGMWYAGSHSIFSSSNFGSSFSSSLTSAISSSSSAPGSSSGSSGGSSGGGGGGGGGGGW